FAKLHSEKAKDLARDEENVKRKHELESLCTAPPL
ncbi:unnamed protein product, partial [marine sediment metagenome]